MKSLDLNIATPEELPRMLREAAQQYRESRIELQSAWQDEHAGRVWDAFALILESAATRADNAIARYV